MRILIYIIIFATLFSCGKSQLSTSDSDVNDLTNIHSDGYIVGLRYYVYKGKEKYWDLLADTAKIYDKKNCSVADSIYVRFYNGDTVSSVLTAKEGYANMKTSDLSARYNVIVRSTTGSTLYTEQIKWDNTRRKITSDTYVKIVRKRDTLTGIGMESNADLEKIVIKKNIRVIKRW